MEDFAGTREPDYLLIHIKIMWGEGEKENVIEKLLVHSVGSTLQDINRAKDMVVKELIGVQIPMLVDIYLQNSD